MDLENMAQKTNTDVLQKVGETKKYKKIGIQKKLQYAEVEVERDEEDQ